MDKDQMIADLQAKVAELEKQSEPVAWIYQDPDTLQPALKFANPTTYWATVISTPDIPLYTTPHHASDVKQTKPLSDEEINQIIKQQDWFSMTWVDMVRRIERTIKEKNEPTNR